MRASKASTSDVVDIAIIGMAARFPGAATVDQFWANVRDGVESIRRLSDEELLAAGVSRSALNDPDYVKACPVLDDVDKFDAAFFGLSGREASVMDPAHRIFLEIAWQAFENAGYTALPEEGVVGVFAAAGAPLYMMENLRTNPDLMRSMGEFLVRHTGNDMNFLATRVSYEMDLRGPSLNVQTACSSSLVSVHLACQSLIRGDCTMALAGGSTVLVPQAQGYQFKEGEILSPDGHCRPFDAKSAGTVFGSGAGAVILKRLSDALDDGDTIHAVIKGSAINNDGAVKVSYLAPGVEGQAEVVAAALDDSGVDADSISYIETHGTGTLVGDPIEVEALNSAYRTRTNRRGYCAIGSVKSNIGHLGEAAGAASLIKAVMALKSRKLPPSLGFEQPNPAIDFENSPFFVNSELQDWASAGVRRCGVTALGAGGTNCHLILEEAPAELPGDGDRSQQLIVLSAKTRTALDLACDRLADALEGKAASSLADAAYTLAVGRRGMPHRRAFATSSNTDAIELLRKRDPKRVVTGETDEHQPKLIFMFPGGGAQYAGMGRELYEQEDIYRDAIDACLAIVEPALGIDLKSLMYPEPSAVEAATRELERPSLTLPSLFATEYALGRLFMSWGVTPDALIGHSVGEYAAACLSGVMSLEDALKLVLMRGRLFEVVRPGSMLSVPLSEADLRALMPAGIDIAAANAAELSVASGPSEAITKLRRILAAREIDSTPIHINVAAHSSMLDPVLGQFRDLCRTIPFKRPEIAFVSNVTGTWITPEQAMSAEYWVSHLRSTVRFADGLAAIAELGATALLEVGPGRTLSSLARAQTNPFRNAFSCVRHPQEPASDLGFALTSLGRLWSAGVDIDWTAFYDGQLRNRIPLPTYPFEGKPFWVAPGKTTAGHVSADVTRHADVTSWFQTVGFAEAPLVSGPRAEAARIWLLLAEDAAYGRQLSNALGSDRVVVATPGKTFGERLNGTWSLNFDVAEHYTQIFRYMEESVGLPDHVVLLTSPKSTDTERRLLAPATLMQIVAELSSDVQVSVVTHGATGAGGGRTEPAHALALGPVLVAPRELPHVQARCIDLPAQHLDVETSRRMLDMLTRELRTESLDTIVALTPTGRWVRRAAPMFLPAMDEASLTWVRDGGVYLVTGGLGGIGMEVAEHLARGARVKLALMGRVPLPPESEWQRLLDDKLQSRQAQRIARVLKLRELGAQVMIVKGDVANRAEVAGAVHVVRKTFGPINGVMHCAGVMDDAPLMTKDADAMRRVLAPKVAGTLALDAAITEDLDFFVMFSSIASYLGLPGQIDYTSANAFQDAFARQRAMRAKGRTVVINWNAWREVGMAASAHKALTGGPAPTYRSRHPALDGYTDTAQTRTFSSTFEGSAEWLLAEHVVKGGGQVLPGTAFVELARAAFAEGRDSGAIEIANLAFASPFRVEKDEPRCLTIQLTPSSDGASISMFSGHDSRSQPIVTGDVRAWRGSAPASIDLLAIRARCSTRIFAPADRKLDQDFMTFGPRWANIVQTAFGQSEALVELALADACLGDLPDYVLHPGMLDMATGGAQALIPGVDLTKDFFVPLGYGSVRVFDAMPARLFSHVRCLPETANGLAYFDVTLANADGKVIAEISRFTMRRLDAVSAFGGARVRAATTRSDSLSEALRDGIATHEGLDALNRIMGQPNLTQVIASSVDIQAWNEKLRGTRAAETVESDQAVEGFERPAGAPEYVAPSNAAERVLAKIWSDLLGYQSIGVQDNFFDMGGNSLLGVRLFAAIRKRFSMSLPLATLFEAQTIADLARLLADPEQDQPATGGGWSPLVCLRPGKPSNTPVFFIHGSRGNVLVFKAFADRMPLEQPVYALQAAGVDGKMPPDQTIDVMAERYLAAIRQVQPKGPYMLAGYSGGGVIAYEITRRLKSTNESVSMLMLIDTLEPSQMHTKVSMLDRLRNLHRIRISRFLNLPATVWKYKLKPRVRKMMGVKEFKALRTPLEHASDLVDAAYKNAQRGYDTPVLETDIILIRASNARMQFLRSGPTLGWKRFVKGSVHRIDVDAEHDFVFEGKALSQLVAAFEEAAKYRHSSPAGRSERAHQAEAPRHAHGRPGGTRPQSQPIKASTSPQKA
jgi:acyl transferase domain-containing protein/thioesterase domain-containing protein